MTTDKSELGAWPLVWQICLILAFVAFAVMAVLVTIGGAKDILTLFAQLGGAQAVENDKEN